MSFTLKKGDITKLDADVIVNAANGRLAPGGGVCGAIFSAAGYDQLDQACRKLGGCETGSAVITPGFALPARHVIHAVGPVWQGGKRNEAQLLGSCYTCSLELALKNRCKSIAFPLISSGIYGYPKEEAFQIAISAIRHFLEKHDMEVYLVLFDQETYQLGQRLMEEEG